MVISRSYALYRIVMFVICTVSLLYCRAEMPMISNILDTLDTALARQPKVLSLRFMQIDSLKASLGKTQMQPDELRKFGDSFRGLNNDSAIHYYSQALKGAKAISDTALIRYLLPELSERLAKGLRFQSAFATLDTIDVSSWPQADKIHYYSSLGHIYIDATYFGNINYRRDELSARAIASLDSLLSMLTNKDARSLVSAQKYFLNDEPTLALGELKEVFDLQDPFSPQYAVMANMLASYYRAKPEHNDEYVYYLALSAISDARRANCEAVSLVHLGEELMRRGDLDRASRYLAVAGEVIGESNSTLYGAEIAPSLSRFTKIWSQREARATKRYIIVIAVLVLILAIVSFFLCKNIRERRRESKHAQKLSSSLINRDHYINQLLNLCGVYVEGLEEYNRLIGRKLKVNQIQDLYKMIESGKLLQEQAEHFFEIFDDAISKIYPDFISEINALLMPDKQITPPTAPRLTPELRIIAFMRLGVTDSNRLSKFLGLSVNTIYTYRNRMKGRAINRAKFEEDIVNLGHNL